MRVRDVCASILIAAVIAPNAFGQVEAIDNCVKRLDPHTDVGYERIAARCPDLTRQLEASSWSAWLPKEWKTPNNDLSADSLKDLRQLVGRELATRTTSRTPSIVPLHAILAELGPMESPSTGVWSRFNRWLREALERGGPSDTHDWWDRMTGRISLSQAFIDAMGYTCLAAVVLMALGLIINELRVAGVFGARRHRVLEGADDRPHKDTTSRWIAIQNAPAADRPRLLLEWIAARLVELKRLPPAGGFTVRELLQSAHFARNEDQLLLADVALTAERVRFSGDQIPLTSLEAVVERGRTLLERLGP
jgi:hypothetical protein